jgi:hypothetical protein
MVKKSKILRRQNPGHWVNRLNEEIEKSILEDFDKNEQ